MEDGSAHLNASSVKMTSTENDPRSTKSPLNRYGFFALGMPLISKMLHKSKNCPCTSPHTVNFSPSGIGMSTTEGNASKIVFACIRISNAYLLAIVFCALNRSIMSSVNSLVMMKSSSRRTPSYALSMIISRAFMDSEIFTTTSSGVAMAASNRRFRSAFSHSLSFMRPSRSLGCIRHTSLKSFNASVRWPNKKCDEARR
mmetsp:Transcript_13219/g.43805  ORF Transcript_13219/g.43805 Transcript_13219/m.43805 type:complete len:200 (+) Transcript_13219:2168-2767(+)